MIGGVESGSTRIRPLSGGFWTLLSWLRGEEHSASSESISSAGSDLTAVSFAFLAPTHYHSTTAPLVVPPPGPPTDSYKKRVRERNLRRQYDRDITLHRKYGLFRGENAVNFDIHSLPPFRRVGTVKDWKDRERRAASECHQRRTAHVPGKRRAPPPPSRIPAAPDVIAVPASTTYRRHSRKRPAPKPPSQTTGQTNKIKNIFMDENNKINMNQSNSPAIRPLTSLGLECKQEKYIKKEMNLKDVKMRPEKSFLKQIFENKKRNSAVDTSLVKVLPSISELDQQAAEIIETSRLRKLNQTNQQGIGTECVWYCIKCSRKYDKSVDACMLCNIKKNVSCKSAGSGNKLTIYTQTEQESPSQSTSNDHQMDEKQKLKEMLKEMKDSLPKRTKLDNLKKDQKNLSKVIMPSIETPTLPIGSGIERTIGPQNKPTLNNQPSKKSESKVLMVQFNETNMHQPPKLDERKTDLNKQPIQLSNNERKALNTPLKISSLLNPIYIPKPNGLHQDQLRKVSSSSEIKHLPEKIESTTDPIYVKTADAVRDILLNSVAGTSPKTPSHVPKHKHITDRCNNVYTDDEQSTSTVANKSNEIKLATTKTNNIDKINNHSRRRDLVNQLEKSIANGDERAAAEAAMKLAQLRLSCSVLSFSSQILQNSQNPPHNVLNNITTPEADHAMNKSIPTSVGRSSILSKESPVKIDPLKSNLTENNKKGLKSHDVSTSTNNILIQKNNRLSTEVATEIKNLPLKVEELPNQSTSNDSGTLAQGIQSKSESTRSTILDSKNKTDDNVSETLAQPSTSKDMNNADSNVKSIAVWIEDKEKAHGPLRLRITINANVGELRRRAEQTLGLPMRLQRWIVGKELCNSDDTALVSLAGPGLDVPFYLCVVECDENVQNQIRDLCQDTAKTELMNNTDKIGEKSTDVYNELVQLERQAVVPNVEAFVCDICIEDCAPGDGVVLRECAHSFCRPCLVDVIRHYEEPAVACPAMGCIGLLHEREIRALVSPEDYEKWLNRGLAAAESGTRNAFHCRTRDCTGWALCDTGARRFPCPVCKHINCVPCQAIHEGETCEQYQTKLKTAALADTADQTDEGTRALIESLISRGEALQCPECNAVITKKWGCDWVRCSACKTEICWVTRGRRWGPAGRGDTSAGCKCGVDGKRCHPSCAYCH
ncbi:unnamed protein product [Chilo suppressalis]|uniref:RBR-type E3 ubiquitin transferase n=1 Tax=Chilo suppressalis TaxID=168631 RepID=A0ABN8BEI8_CHISP|nr:unnamed protein product [Chilo suppressalis]